MLLASVSYSCQRHFLALCLTQSSLSPFHTPKQLYTKQGLLAFQFCKVEGLHVDQTSWRDQYKDLKPTKQARLPSCWKIGTLFSIPYPGRGG